jgi:hypothetical protein
MDFLGGQVCDRPYDEQQRLPGDWEAIVGQRPIAIHALEHPTAADLGVFIFRKLLREGIRGKNSAAEPEVLHGRAYAGKQLYTYTQNTVLDIPQRSSTEDDRQMIREIGRKLVAVTSEGDTLESAERAHFIRRKIEKMERNYR